MKKIILVLIMAGFFQTSGFCQSYNAEKIALSNFIVRMYKSEPFTGVKVFLDYDNKYLISLVKLSTGNYSSESAMNRVAEVKAKAQVNQFLNGSYISVESIVTTTATTSKKNGSSVSEISEVIKESSIGYVDALELISMFADENESDKKVFIFLRELEKIKKKK